MPLIPTGATLAAAAAGTYDSHYVSAAQALAATRPQDSVIYIRVGWEFNGNWYPWAAQGLESSYIGAFRKFVAAFRSVSSRFSFEWCTNNGGSWDPSTAYPGDDVVDIIGTDVYWQTALDGNNPVTAWSGKVYNSWGLNWLQTFAAQRGKPISISEWGIQTDAATLYIDLAYRWFIDHKVIRQTYWNSSSSFNGTLSNDQYPTSGAEFKRLFGGS